MAGKYRRGRKGKSRSTGNRKQSKTCAIWTGLYKANRAASKSRRTPRSLKKGLRKAKRTIESKLRSNHCATPTAR